MEKTKVIYLCAIWLSLVLPLFNAVAALKSAATAQEAVEAKKEKEDNPFLDRDTELKYQDKDRRIIGDMILTAVFYSGDNSRAIIDGRIVKRGDIINNLEVTEIKSQKVYFKDYLGKKYTLKMLSILSAIKAEEEAEEDE